MHMHMDAMGMTICMNHRVISAKMSMINHPKLMERNDSGESESNEDIIYIYILTRIDDALW